MASFRRAADPASVRFDRRADDDGARRDRAARRHDGGGDARAQSAVPPSGHAAGRALRRPDSRRTRPDHARRLRDAAARAPDHLPRAYGREGPDAERHRVALRGEHAAGHRGQPAVAWAEAPAGPAGNRADGRAPSRPPWPGGWPIPSSRRRAAPPGSTESGAGRRSRVSRPSTASRCDSCAPGTRSVPTAWCGRASASGWRLPRADAPPGQPTRRRRSRPARGCTRCGGGKR